MTDSVIIGLAVAAAVAFFARRLIRQVTTAGCGCNCDKVCTQKLCAQKHEGRA